MEPKSIISITLLGIISACLVAIKACPQTENYGFYGNESNPQGIHPLGSNNQHDVYIMEAGNQLMNNNSAGTVWAWSTKASRNSTPDGHKHKYEPALSRCEYCDSVKMRVKNHEDAHKILQPNLDTNGLGVNALSSHVNNSYFKNHVGNGAPDYIRGSVDICTEPQVSFHAHQLNKVGHKQTKFMS